MARAALTSASTWSGGGSTGSSTLYAALANLQDSPRARRKAGGERVGRGRGDQLPSAHLEGDHVRELSGGHQPATGQDRDPAAQRFSVAEHV